MASRSRKNVDTFAWLALLPRVCVGHQARFLFSLEETDDGLTWKRLYNLALRSILHIEMSAEMLRLDFSFDCKVFALSFRVGSKPCTCSIYPPTEKAPSVQHNWGNDATQISDLMLLTTSGLLDSKTEKTLGLLLPRAIWTRWLIHCFLRAQDYQKPQMKKSRGWYRRRICPKCRLLSMLAGTWAPNRPKTLQSRLRTLVHTKTPGIRPMSQYKAP